MRSVVVVVFVAGCGGGAGPVSGGPGGGGPVPVQVEAARAPSLQTSWTLLGDVRPLTSATLTSQVAAVVVDVAVREGDRVAPGDLLVRLDDDLAAAQLASARAARQQADVDRFIADSVFQRIERVSDGVVSDADRVAAKGRRMAAEAGLVAADAHVVELQVAVDRHSVTAPWAGVVTRRLIDPGAAAQPGTPLLALASTDDVEVLVDGPADLLGVVAPGAEVTLRGTLPVTGHVAGVVPVLDGTTRTVRLRITPDSLDGLVAGAQVQVEVAWTREDGDAVVPLDALVPDPAGTTLVRLDGDQPQRLTAQVVATAGDAALVRAEGLAPGDTVVTRGNERLRPGTPVRVTDVVEGE